MKQIFTLLLGLLFFGAAAQNQSTFHRGYFDGNSLVNFANGKGLTEASNGDFVYTFSYGLMRTDNTGEPLWNAFYTHMNVGATFPQRASFDQVIEAPGGDLILLG